MRGFFPPVAWRWAIALALSLALVLVGSGCGAVELVPPTPVSVQPAATVIPTWTPTPAPTWAPVPTPTPTGLHGRIVFVRESTIGKGLAPVSNLWAVHLDGSRLEQWTFDPGGIGLFYSSEPSPHLIFASATQLAVDTSKLRWIPLPERCAQRDELGPACFDVMFSPTGRYVTFVMFPAPEIRGCWGDLQVMDTTTLQVVKSVPSAGLRSWITDTVALVVWGHCEGSRVYALDLETGEMEGLGEGGAEYWSPDHTAFVTVAEPYPGPWRHIWAYDVEKLSLIRSEQGAGNFLEDSPCWTPDGSRVLYTRQSLIYTDYYTVTIGPRQVMMLDRDSGDERMVLGDVDHDYFIGWWYLGRWTCTWQGDWLPVQVTSYRTVTTSIDPWGKDFAVLNCVLYGQHCPDAEFLALNWRTGEMVPWEEAPLPTPTPAPTPTPTPTSGPDLAATPIYVDPGGAFALYPGPGGVGLWRVPAEGESVVLIEDGHYFVYVP
jgi:hypothetical protein